jgi:hypothetical protein
MQLPDAHSTPADVRSGSMAGFPQGIRLDTIPWGTPEIDARFTRVEHDPDHLQTGCLAHRGIPMDRQSEGSVEGAVWPQAVAADCPREDWRDL